MRRLRTSCDVGSFSVGLVAGQFLIVEGRLTAAGAQAHFKKSVGMNAQYRGNAGGDEKEAGVWRSSWVQVRCALDVSGSARPRRGDPSHPSV